ncbi:hypothetical protein [Lutibacter sp.]|uniref:hypothetical protein n=1 Tax=Lutibacter sp. TaxID=1925666 RepID=UPI003562480C
MTAIQSKINQLNARINQFQNSEGLFSAEEIESLIAPLKLELAQLAKEIEVESPKIIK